jgi:hypothetical protein
VGAGLPGSAGERPGAEAMYGAGRVAATSERVEMSGRIDRFEFHAEPEVIRDLETRPRRAVWLDEIAAEPSRYGPPISHTKGFVDHWLERFD